MKRIVCTLLTLCFLATSAQAQMMLTSYYNAPSPGIAAHRTLPFGTILRVTNDRNGRSVVVRIHDRGPFVPGRKLDISEQYARVLGIIQAGIALLRVDILHIAHG